VELDYGLQFQLLGGGDPPRKKKEKKGKDKDGRSITFMEEGGRKRGERERVRWGHRVPFFGKPTTPYEGKKRKRKERGVSPGWGAKKKDLHAAHFQNFQSLQEKNR